MKQQREWNVEWLRVVNEFCSVCKRRKLKVNAGKSKVMVFERREVEVVDFNTAYRVRQPAVKTLKALEKPSKPKKSLKTLNTLNNPNW